MTNPAIAELQKIVNMNLPDRWALEDMNTLIAAIAASMLVQAELDPEGKLFNIVPAQEPHYLKPLHGIETTAPLIVMDSRACGCNTLKHTQSRTLEEKYFQDFQPGGELHIHSLALCADDTFAQFARLSSLTSDDRKPYVSAVVFRLDETVRINSLPRHTADPEQIISGMLNGESWNMELWLARGGYPQDATVLDCLAQYVKLRAKNPCTNPAHAN